MVHDFHQKTNYDQVWSIFKFIFFVVLGKHTRRAKVSICIDITSPVNHNLLEDVILIQCVFVCFLENLI